MTNDELAACIKSIDEKLDKYLIGPDSLSDRTTRAEMRIDALEKDKLPASVKVQLVAQYAINGVMIIYNLARAHWKP